MPRRDRSPSGEILDAGKNEVGRSREATCSRLARGEPFGKDLAIWGKYREAPSHVE
jgi:hypothetical protein